MKYIHCSTCGVSVWLHYRAETQRYIAELFMIVHCKPACIVSLQVDKGIAWIT